MIDDVVRAYNEGDVDLHQMVADFAGISRKEAKVVNLGIMYGMGKGKLAGQLGITEAQAGELLATHHEKVPFVKGLADLAMQQAAKHGVIRTLLGRRCNFHLWEPRTFGYNKPLPFDEAMNDLRPAAHKSVYLQGLKQTDPRIGGRPDQKGDGRLLRRGPSSYAHGPR
jgi:DNA polymerase I-like protein with 3'-5' exonuclease and polymerase domains